MNEYFQAGSTPAPSSPGASAAMRSEFASIASAFDKLPVMAGSPNEFVVVNATGTALISSGFVFADLTTVTGTQTLTNKTMSWTGNTWVGFGTGATKNVGTLAGQVLLLAEDNKLPAMDAGNLTNIPGLSLKADANNAVLTGAPTVSTPVAGDNSSRIANTLFVNQLVAAVGGATPSGAAPLMNGVANAGSAIQVSRDDHVHPTDTSRAPSSAATAVGTSFTPAGTIAANTVQAAIAELDTESQASLALKAPLASPVFTGDPRAPTAATSDNDTSIATTAFVQALLAQQPPGASVSNAVPLINGTAASGSGVAASRDDHVHPTDTSRAPVNSPTFTGTVGGITKAMVGLGNVDNTADASKPVSTAQQTELNLKAPIASPTFIGAVTAPQYYNVSAGYGALQVGGVDAFRFGSDTSGQLAGFRNRIINGAFNINQRGVSGTVVLLAGQYGHDGFKAGPGGCTYTFADSSAGYRIITIIAGTLMQIIRGKYIQSGQYILSWMGSSQAKIDAGSFAFSPILNTAFADVNKTIEWGMGTLALAQFAPGSITTTFEFRDDELQRCQRSYEVGSTPLESQLTAVGNFGSCTIYFKVTKDAAVTFTKVNGARAVGTPTITLSSDGAQLLAAGAVGDRVAISSWTASAEL